MIKGGGYLSCIDLKTGANRVDRWVSKLEYRQHYKQAHKRVNRLLRQFCYR